MSDDNEEIWLTYEGILSEVEDEYKAKFDATETVKQWAVARRMYQAGRRNATQELIEKAEEEREDLLNRLDKLPVPLPTEEVLGRTMMEREGSNLWAVSYWLKSQMEGE